MKLINATPALLCALFITAGTVSGASKAKEEPGIAVSSQTTAQDGSAVSTLSGSWQMSWISWEGKVRQGTLQIQQDGSKLSGIFQGPRGPFPLTGSANGNQVSFSLKAHKRKIAFTGTVQNGGMSGSTEQGTSWSATRQ